MPSFRFGIKLEIPALKLLGFFLSFSFRPNKFYLKSLILFRFDPLNSQLCSHPFFQFPFNDLYCNSYWWYWISIFFQGKNKWQKPVFSSNFKCTKLKTFLNWTWKYEKNKNILKTSEAENRYNFKNAQPGLEKCGSYKKKSVYDVFNIFIHMHCNAFAQFSLFYFFCGS